MGAVVWSLGLRGRLLHQHGGQRDHRSARTRHRRGDRHGHGFGPCCAGHRRGRGSAIGELTGYVAGATGSALIPEHQRHHFDRIHRLTDRYGAVILGVLAAIPFPLFDLAGVVAGMLRMSVPVFLISVSIGKSIKYILLIVAGAAPLFFLQQLFR
ncbi:MAG: VTT domain-containing protein [Caldilineaceae bacterium]|nr:VTT domain-containing protein [Caldilineaceae bacterium]